MLTDKSKSRPTRGSRNLHGVAVQVSSSRPDLRTLASPAFVKKRLYKRSQLHELAIFRGFLEIPDRIKALHRGAITSRIRRRDNEYLCRFASIALTQMMQNFCATFHRQIQIQKNNIGAGGVWIG